jgi:hypothetical protein
MFCLTPEARNLELVKTGNRGFRGSKTSAANRIHLVRSRVYKDEALVAETLRGLPGLLASLESFRE